MSVPIYCIKCQSKTDTDNVKDSVSKNGRKMIKGKCKDCGQGKSQFVGRAEKAEKTGQKGGSFLDKLINSGKLPELHYISPFTGKRHNFTGPGTKLEKRIDPKTKQ